jgi:hypothetical protein
MSYKSVVPRTQLAAYTPGIEVNFDLLHDGESIVPGSLFITGELAVVAGAAAKDGSLEHYMDNHAGVGAFFENVITRCDAFQEVITNYGRLCKHNAMLQYSPDQLCSGLAHTNEMRAPHVNLGRLLVDSAATAPWSFCHKPLVALNNMSGPLSSAKSGRIQFSFKCPSVQKVFFGANSADLTNYQFTNLQLHYQTSLAAQGPVTINIVQDTQKLIATSRTTIMNTFPDSVDKVVVSFADTTTETDATKNSLVCQFPPISKASWVYNDVSNGLVAYNIETQEELVLSGLNVMKSAGVAIDVRDKMALAAQDAVHNINDNFALGLVLGAQTDFSRSGLGCTIELQQGTQTQFYAFFYAYGAKQIA